MPKKLTTLRRKTVPANTMSAEQAKLGHPEERAEVTVNTVTSGASNAPTSVLAHNYPAHSNPLSKIEMLYRFVAACPDFVVGDDLATLSLCVGTVLIASIFLGTKSARVISFVTTYPQLFVAAVFQEFERQDFATTDRWLGMVEDSTRVIDNVEEMRLSLESVLELFWNGFWTPQAQIALDSLRSRALFGGGLQNWIDIGAAEHFGLEAFTE